MQHARPGKTFAALVFLVGALLPGVSTLAAGHQPAQINVGYFRHWPAPAHFAQENQTFDSVLGVRVNWLPYRNGREMTAALARGDLQIAFSLGQVPLLVAASSGVDLTVVGIALSYPEDDNCIVRADAGIGRANAIGLEGKTAALQPGSVSHFRLLKVLARLGVDSAKVKILAVADGNAALRALQQGDAVMACSNGSALRRMGELGDPLVSGKEQESLGLKLFDVIAASTPFAEQHADLLQAFMDVIEAANRQWRTNPQAMLRSMARVADMDRDSARDSLRGFRFPLAEEQKSDAWLGRQVPEYIGELANFFAEQGQLEQLADGYERFFSTRFLR